MAKAAAHDRMPVSPALSKAGSMTSAGATSASPQNQRQPPLPTRG